MKRVVSIFILIMCAVLTFAQTDRQHIRQGNRLYRQQKFDKAEVDYRKAADKNQKNPQALYNLGCALMQQQKDSFAVVQFQAAAQLEKNKIRKAKIYHNIGVICQQQRLFDDAIESYKESLRNNPKDDQTRYNLALCMRQRKEQDGGQGHDKDDNGNDKQKDQQQQEDKQQPKQDKQQQQKEQMSKENAEQLLQAAMQEEKQTQQKMKQQQAQPQQRRLQKNW